jgi:hypothetical protein
MFDKTLHGTIGYEEMSGALLPDERYRNNLMKMCNSLLEKPGHSFSSACGPIVRKTASGLFSKEKNIDLQSGHLERTISRCKDHNLLLVLEDSTDLNYNPHLNKTGMGNIGGGGKGARGLSMHSAIIVSTLGEPLGLVGQYIWAPVSTGRKKQHREYPIEEKESYKWLRTKKWVNNALGSTNSQVIVVGDREADFHEHFTFDRSSNIDLLVRAGQVNRNVIHKGEKKKVKQVAVDEQAIGEIEVKVKRQKDRKARTAKLMVKVTKVTCPPTVQKHAKRVDAEMTLIYIKEIEGGGKIKDPIEWYLYTSVEINSLAAAAEMVKYYSLRWIIERFHYVLKSGLRIEKMQFDNFTRTANALKIYSIVGWKLLWLNYVGKAHPQADAADYFEALEIEILELFTLKKIKNVKQFILALGSLSGFSPSTQQPLPGEKLLWQSLKLLTAMKKGFLLRNNKKT